VGCQDEAVVTQLADVAYGSWLCENALAEAPTTCDLGEAAVFGHRAAVAAFFVWNGS
jgi:hypothetical protein